MKYVGAFLLGVLLLAAVSYSLAFELGAPNGTSGAPGESTCAQSGCHDQFPLNSGPGFVHVMAPPFFWNVVEADACLPETSAIRIHVVQEGSIRWGVQLTSREPGGAPKGHLHTVDSLLTWKTVDSAGHEYVTHTATGTFEGQVDSSGMWWVDWVPEYDEDSTLWLYFSAVAADGDGTADGDYVYAYSLPVESFLYECYTGFPGDFNNTLTVSSADIIYLVNFVFKSGPPPLAGAVQGDINCDGADTAADIIKVVNYVFKGGSPPCQLCGNCCVKSETSWTCP